MGRFWAAATPERFAAAAASPNVVLANRDLASALRFVERISTYLAEFEEKISHTHIVLVGEGTAHTHT